MAALGAAPAHANTFAATELSYDAALLSQFNLINLGNWNVSPNNGSSLIQISGPVIAGSVTTGANGLGIGTASNTTIGATSSTTAGVVAATSGSNQAYGALTVFGNVMGDVESYTKISINGSLTGNPNATANTLGGNGGTSLVNNGTLDITGSLGSKTVVRDTNTFNSTQPATAYTASNFNGNVPNKNYSQTLATVFPFASEQSAFSTPLQNLYAGLANLPGTPGVKADALPTSQSGVFTSGVDYTGSNGKTYGVVTTTLANFSAEGSSFTGVANNSANAATFVIITGTGANYVLPTITNADSKVIYDFVGASNLQLGGNFDGTILAPLANLVNGTGTVQGTVVVASMTQTTNLYGNAFTGDLSGLTSFAYNPRVPEPASLGLLGVGAGVAAILRRRRRK